MVKRNLLYILVFIFSLVLSRCATLLQNDKLDEQTTRSEYLELSGLVNVSVNGLEPETVVILARTLDEYGALNTINQTHAQIKSGEKQWKLIVKNIGKPTKIFFSLLVVADDERERIVNTGIAKILDNSNIHDIDLGQINLESVNIGGSIGTVIVDDEIVDNPEDLGIVVFDDSNLSRHSDLEKPISYNSFYPNDNGSWEGTILVTQFTKKVTIYIEFPKLGLWPKVKIDKEVYLDADLSNIQLGNFNFSTKVINGTVQGLKGNDCRIWSFTSSITNYMDVHTATLLESRMTARGSLRNSDISEWTMPVAITTPQKLWFLVLSDGFFYITKYGVDTDSFVVLDLIEMEILERY